MGCAATTPRALARLSSSAVALAACAWVLAPAPAYCATGHGHARGNASARGRAGAEHKVEASIVLQLTPPSEGLPQTDKIDLYVPERFRDAGAKLPYCTVAVLKSKGAGGCPKRSIVGSGSSMGYTILGAQFVEEPLKLTVLNGPKASLLTWVEGHSPVAIEEVVEGAVSKPGGYGQEFSFTIPHDLLEPLPGAPGWLQTLNARISGSSGWLRSTSCPPHGWSLRASLGYTNGQALTISANLTCV